MHVKVFTIDGGSNIEATIQSWLNSNPRITIEGMSQSALDIRGKDYYVYIVTIIYSINR